MGTVVVAGATGYLGRHLVQAFLARGWHVRALMRSARDLPELAGAEAVIAQATQPGTLGGVMRGADLVVSALGITRQQDGLSYRDVDYQANLNLLQAALAAEVPQFAYVHVLGADKMRHVPLVAAKQAFVDQLRAAPLKSLVIAPSGFFSDMADFFQMARAGRVWLFGTGKLRLNPIHGADLAEALCDGVAAEQDDIEIGGPDVLSHDELARLAFAALGRPARITHLPDLLRRIALRLLPWVTPARVHGPALFFLTALGQDMTAPPHGTRHLADHFAQLAREAAAP